MNNFIDDIYESAKIFVDKTSERLKNLQIRAKLSLKFISYALNFVSAILFWEFVFTIRLKRARSSEK